jgi:hypothetical protein
MVDALPLAWGVVGLFVLVFIALLLMPVYSDRTDGFVSGPGPNLDPAVPIKSSGMDRLIAFFDRPMPVTRGYGDRAPAHF